MRNTKRNCESCQHYEWDPGDPDVGWPGIGMCKWVDAKLLNPDVFDDSEDIPEATYRLLSNLTTAIGDLMWAMAEMEQCPQYRAKPPYQPRVTLSMLKGK